MKQLDIKLDIKRQYDQILVGGWPVLWQKVQRLVQLPRVLIYFFLAFPLVLLIRLISPFVIVRIYEQDFGRIGGVYQCDWYLTLKADDKHHGRNLDFFIFDCKKKVMSTIATGILCSTIP